MDYILLSKLYYQNLDLYESTYSTRFHSEYSVHLDFDIAGSPAFFVLTPEIYTMQAKILRMNAIVSKLCHELPGVAIGQFSRRCLIDEIVITNSIEGVRSTRREISELLDELGQRSHGKRFAGLVQKYNMLMSKESLPLDSCQDIRDIYNELALSEVIEENPQNAPDGKWFRKDSVSIYSPSQKEIHRGLHPEDKIITAINQALFFLHEDSCDILFRISIFHYLIEYIHPFYDGNGRLGRFICSYLLSQELAPVTGYRLSYTIKEHLTIYNQAFSACNNPLNRGDLTPFLYMFLSIVQESVEKLKNSLQEGYTRLNRCLDKISQIVQENDDTLVTIYGLLIQAALFSEFGISTDLILKYVNISRNTLNSKLKKIPVDLLIKAKRGRVNFYSIHIDVLDPTLKNPSEQTKSVTGDGFGGIP